VGDKLSAATLTLTALLVGIGAPLMVVGGNDQARLVGGVLTGVGSFGFLSGIALLLWPHRRRDVSPAPAPSTPPPATRRSVVPASAPEPRLFTDRSPEDLVGFFSRGLTDMQAQKLFDPFVGKWLRISGPVSTVRPSGMVSFADRGGWQQEKKGVYLFFDGPEWLDRLAMLSPGTEISAVGRIDGVSQSTLVLHHCELVG
jgi:hypothetical protein